MNDSGFLGHYRG